MWGPHTLYPTVSWICAHSETTVVLLRKGVLFGSFAPRELIRFRIVLKIEETSKFLHYSFHPDPCFVYSLTSVPEFSKPTRLPIPQPQDLSSSVLQSAPRISPLRPNFLILSCHNCNLKVTHCLGSFHWWSPDSRAAHKSNLTLHHLFYFTILCIHFC